MEPTPQQVEEDVLVGPFKPPPLNLEVMSRRDGLLKDLVVLGYVPIMEVVIWDMGLIHQDRRHQLPKGLASINPEDKSFGYCQEHGIFQTFSLLFLCFSLALIPPPFFSLGFTLQEKIIRVQLIM